MAIRSRRIVLLTRREERKKIKKTVYLLLASGIILVILFMFGTPFLGKFADVLDTIFGKKTAEQSLKAGTLQPPRFSDLPSATNGARLTISGFTQDDGTVEIYVNDNVSGKTKSDSGKFDFEISLKDGNNEVKAKLISGGRESDFSKSANVKLVTTEPSLTIDSPSDGQSFTGVNRIQVTGKTDSDAQVYANQFLANVGADGRFEAFVTLSEGDNNIEIKAIDPAGNIKIEKRKVHYSK